MKEDKISEKEIIKTNKIIDNEQLIARQKLIKLGKIDKEYIKAQDVQEFLASGKDN